MDDIVGTCEVETETASLERDEENGAFTSLKFLHETLAFFDRYCAVYIYIRYREIFECLLYL